MLQKLKNGSKQRKKTFIYLNVCYHCTSHVDSTSLLRFEVSNHPMAPMHSCRSKWQWWVLCIFTLLLSSVLCGSCFITSADAFPHLHKCQESRILLLQSIEQGTKEDKIWSMMNAGERDTADETFIHWFDGMFGEDCQDPNGCLLHIHRGKLGMGSLPHICPKSTGQMGLHWILSRLSYNVLSKSSDTFRMLPTLFYINYILTDTFLVDPKQVQSSKCGHHARWPQL
jgi:hypothetical protein